MRLPHETRLTGERGLFRAVLARAWRDARGGSRADAVTHAERGEALAWFLEGDDDYLTVCALAGVEPQRFRRRTLGALGVPVG